MAKKKSEEHSGADANDSDYNEEPNFDDPPNFVDNISDEGKFDCCQRSTRATNHRRQLQNANITSMCALFYMRNAIMFVSLQICLVIC